MKNYLWRIQNDKVKLFFMAILVALPILQVVQTFISCGGEQELYNAYFATFQSLPGVNHHIIQRLYTWFMPLYLLVIFTEGSIEEAETHLANVLICKRGKKKYILEKAGWDFAISFSLILIAMLINLILCLIVFKNGTYMDMDPNDGPETKLYVWSFAHPLLANLAFDLVTAYVFALLCVVGTSISMVIPDRKVVYGATLLLWFVPVTMKKSIVLVFQPFAEFDIDYLLPVFLAVTISYIAVIVVFITWRLQSEEI